MLRFADHGWNCPLCQIPSVILKLVAVTRQDESFFAELFDWKMEDTGPATYIQTGDDVGRHFTALGHEPHNYTIFSIRVGDVKAYLEKANALGGKTLVGRSQFLRERLLGSLAPKET